MDIMITKRHLSFISFLILPIGLFSCGDEDGGPEVDGKPQAAHFVLDVTKSERLARIYHDRNDEHARAVYEVRGADGVRLHRGSTQSPSVQKILSLNFFDANDASYIAHAQVDGGQALLVGTSQSVTMSPIFQSMGTFVRYGLNRHHAAVEVMIAAESGDNFEGAVMFWESGDFTVGPRGRSVSKLEITPDQKQVQYELQRRYRNYGVAKQVFTSRPEWFDLGGTDIWAYGGKHADGYTVFVDHQPGETFKTVRNIHLDPDQDQLVYQGQKGKKWFVVSESRAEGNLPSTKQGPFTSMEYRLRHHKKTANYYGVGKTDDGNVLVVGNSDNSATTSDGFKRLTIQRFETSTQPIALGSSNAGDQVLIGTKAGSAYASVQSLSAADNEATVAYIAKNDAGVRVVLGTTEQRKFDAVSNYLLSTPSEHPTYVGKDGDAYFAMHEGKASEGLDKFSLFRTRSKDRVYWKATKGEGEVLGFETTPGKKFDTITSVGITPTPKAAKGDDPPPPSKHTVWYDGKRGDDLHRTIETDESPAFSAMGSVLLTAKSFDIVYAARNSRLDSEEVTVDEKIKVVETVSFTDIVTRNGSKLASFKRSMPGDSKGKRYLGSSTTDLPRPQKVNSTDHLYYTAISDGGTSVGFDGRVDGPFASLKELKVRPTKNDVAYFAQKDERWAVQEGASRGTELDSMTGRLSFTPDGLQVFYSGKKDSTSHTFVGSEQYLAVKDMKLGPNKDLLVYRGERTEGWHLVVGGAHSNPFASIGRTQFTDDSYGVYAEAKNTDKSSSFLLKPHAKPFEADGKWAWAGGLTEYHNLVVGGPLRLNAFTKNYQMMAADGEPRDLSKLPDPSTNPVFVGMGRTTGAVTKGWLVEAVVEGELVLRNGPSRSDLKRWQRGYRADTAYVLPLYSPHAYSAKAGKTSGMVYMSEHYSRWYPKGFTENRRFYAVGRQDDRDHFIMGESRTGSYHRIDDIVFNPAKPSDDKVALKIQTEGRQYGYVLTAADVQTTALGLADSAHSAEWTQPHVPTGINTLVWSGRQSQTRFRAVHDRRYDAVNGVVVTPVTGDLSYVGTRDILHSVYARAEHGPWYNRIRLYGVHEKSGIPAYVGDIVYALNGDPISSMGPGDRWLSRAHVGKDSGQFVDNIKHLYGGSDLNNTFWTGQINGLWSLYKGNDTTTKGYRTINWLHRLADKKDKDQATYHFLGRKDDVWVEVHDGSEGTTVDAIVKKANVVTDVPEYLTQVPENNGGTPSNAVLIDEDGRFDYRGVLGSRHVFVHQGNRQKTVGTVGRTWYLNKGAELAYEGKETAGVTLVLNGQKTPLYKAIDTVAYADVSDRVYAIAQLIEDDTTDAQRDDESEPTYTPKFAILDNTDECLRMKSYSDYKSGENGLALMAEVEDGWQAWVNSGLGPLVEEVGLPSPVFGKSLRDSRYVGKFGPDSYVMSDEMLTEPLDRVTTLYKSQFAQGVFVYHGVRGHIERQFVNDAIIAEAENVNSSVSVFDQRLMLDETDANESESLMGSEVFEQTEIKAFHSGAVVAVTDLGKTYLDTHLVTTAPRHVIWDVKVKLVEPKSDQEPVSYELAWVSGILKRKDAKVSVYLEKTPIEPADGKLTAIQSLKDYRPTLKVDLAGLKAAGLSDSPDGPQDL